MSEEISREEIAALLARGSEEMAIKALEQEPCEDMVSRGVFEQVMWERDVAIEQLKELGYGFGEKPRTGHWIYDRTRDWDGECKYECSCCGMGSDVDYAYCMRCGAKMESEEQA